ncbi:MAG: hypothetical protein PVJ67_03690 [Candidatus Pacearchaeota archaeon]|jgi:hypothetical protein
MFAVWADPKNKAVEVQISKLALTQHRAIRQAFYRIGKDLIKESKKMILAKPKHGRLYKLRRKKQTVLHRASRAGEAPASFTGSLWKSLDFDVIGSDKMQFGAKQEFQNRKGNPKGVTYAKYLENGTYKMAQRPYLITSIKKNQRNIRNHFESKLKQYLTKKV